MEVPVIILIIKYTLFALIVLSVYFSVIHLFKKLSNISEIDVYRAIQEDEGK